MEYRKDEYGMGLLGIIKHMHTPPANLASPGNLKKSYLKKFKIRFYYLLYVQEVLTMFMDKTSWTYSSRSGSFTKKSIIFFPGTKLAKILVYF